MLHIYGNMSLNKSCKQNNTVDNPQSGLKDNGTNTLDTHIDW